MGCTSSKPKVDPPAPSVPSSVTPSNKAVGNEKTVRFADVPTEISDKRNYEDNYSSPSPGHSVSILKNVVEEGNTYNNDSTNKNKSTVSVSPTVKVEEPMLHHKLPEPVVEQHSVEALHHSEIVIEQSVVHSEPERVHIETVETVVEHPVKHSEEVHVDTVTHHHTTATTTAAAEEPVEKTHEEVKPVPTPCTILNQEPAVTVAPATAISTTAPATAVQVVTPSPTTPSDEIKIPEKKKGYILKQGHVVKNWKNRFFILEEGMLTYYESSTANAPYGVNKKGEMNLLDITVTDSKSLVTLSSRGKGQADLVLEIKYPNEREEWIAALKQHIAYLKSVRAARF